MATVRDLRKWLDDMGEDYTVYTDDKGDLCVDNAGCRHATYRFYPEGDDTSDSSWYWRNVMAKWARGRAWRCVMEKPYQLALTEDEFAEKYTDLCNYIEAMWSKRRCKDYYHVDDEDILPVVSPQSRSVALKICMDILGIAYEPWERTDRVLASGRRKAAKKKARK